MRALQERFLNEHNIDAFLSVQDEEVLEYFHQNYNSNNHHSIRLKADEEETKSPTDNNTDSQQKQITEKPNSLDN